MPIDVGELRARWGSLGGGGGGAAAVAVFDDLVRRYAEPHRHYHTIEHVADCLVTFDRFRSLARDPAAVEWAIWFHDVVYDPRSTDNEERSADVARAALAELGVPAAVAERVAALVLMTKRHDVPDGDVDGALLVDTDLAVLGADAAAYARYAAAVRREFAWVDARAYRAGRAAVLRAFLARPRIYRMPAVAAEREARARENLAAEVRSLEDEERGAAP